MLVSLPSSLVQMITLVVMGATMQMVTRYYYGMQREGEKDKLHC